MNGDPEVLGAALVTALVNEGLLRRGTDGDAKGADGDYLIDDYNRRIGTLLLDTARDSRPVGEDAYAAVRAELREALIRLRDGDVPGSTPDEKNGLQYAAFWLGSVFPAIQRAALPDAASAAPDAPAAGTEPPSLQAEQGAAVRPAREDGPTDEQAAWNAGYESGLRAAVRPVEREGEE